MGEERVEVRVLQGDPSNMEDPGDDVILRVWVSRLSWGLMALMRPPPLGCTRALLLGEGWWWKEGG